MHTPCWQSGFVQSLARGSCCGGDEKVGLWPEFAHLGKQASQGHGFANTYCMSPDQSTLGPWGGVSDPFLGKTLCCFFAALQSLLKNPMPNGRHGLGYFEITP
jgi:hypothetical protein